MEAEGGTDSALYLKHVEGMGIANDLTLTGNKIPFAGVPSFGALSRPGGRCYVVCIDYQINING